MVRWAKVRKISKQTLQLQYDPGSYWYARPKQDRTNEQDDKKDEGILPKPREPSA